MVISICELFRENQLVNVDFCTFQLAKQNHEKSRLLFQTSHLSVLLQVVMLIKFQCLTLLKGSMASSCGDGQSEAKLPTATINLIKYTHQHGT